ncbi:MurR/RpiR family transcriptional regulator [Enterocloster citroniae]|uniref:MurR/RpiR family transcriptional regulator n=1 Tax=Enterocloster citroniae TaxID=358743 RepID=UPI00349EC95E
MNRLSERLKEAKLTPQQRRIADYFFKNQERVGNMSSMDVAKEIGVSDASIIRFARAIGYLGFTDLKNDIYNSLIGETSASVRNMQLSERFDVLAGKYQEEDIPGAFVEMMNYNITRTFQQNSLESYEKLADMIIESKRKYVAGLRGCMGVSAHFSRLLGFAINGVTHLPSNSETEVLGALQDVGPEDIFILFSFARYYKIDMLLINMAKEHKGRICVVTDSLMAPMIKYADISLVVETSHMSFFNSAIGADMIAEYIITLVCRKNKEEYRLRARERDIMTEGFRLMQ